LHIAPGQVYIEVVYDYEYKSKDRFITIREGECYMLVKKTNEDWWQVRKDEAAKPFYVPAQYVREDSQKGRSSTLPRTRAQSPDPVRAPLDVDVTHHCDSAGEERRTNDSESGDELSSSSTEHLQVTVGIYFLCFCILLSRFLQ
ncbi:hypothetical protein XENOCAPTIV_028039, partial [Xenoophorus captivus]